MTNQLEKGAFSGGNGRSLRHKHEDIIRGYEIVP